MTEWSFRVPGPLYAYRRLRDRGGYRQYDRFKKLVAYHALAAGFTPRATSSKDSTFRLWVGVFWKKAPRIDASNVLKGIEDALFDQDRWILDVAVQMFPDTKGDEYAMVRLDRLVR